MTVLEVNATQLHVVDEGPRDAPAVLMSPSMFFDVRMFRHQAAALSDRYRVVRYDHRGQGDSARHPREELGIDTLADDAAALIEALDLAPVTVVGNSMGGFVALRLAARRPELVRSAVVMGTSADVEASAEQMEGLAAVMLEHGMTDEVLAGALHFMLGDTTLTDPSRAAVLEEVRGMLASRGPEYGDAVWNIAARDSIVEELRAITAPLLVVSGTEDHTYPLAAAEQIADAVPQAELVVMERVGHVHAIEDPDQVTALLERHLAEVTAA